ncbi:DUF4160 domain-containing protein [Collinsella phocaeensis]|uniref:DUF4160 domain-containing protein n=1 Tax=Collinsella phocaeensis TaxID=1871016 RepID=UPI00093056BD|nr:DUF4160 domain-containing protein [Collinsella phocaeensis]
MPQVFTFGRYLLYFWTGEDAEPVHIHVTVKRPEKNATKFWLLSDGGCQLASNTSDIPSKDLNKLAKAITLNHQRICKAWCETFGSENLHFID